MRYFLLEFTNNSDTSELTNPDIHFVSVKMPKSMYSQSPLAAAPEYLADKYIIDTNFCFQVLDSLLCAS